MKTQIPAISPELKNAVKVYILAKAHEDTIRPIVEGCKLKILIDGKYTYDQKHMDRRDNLPEYITSLKDTWMMDDEQHDQYMRRVWDAHHANGFAKMLEGLEIGYCPLAMAESTTIDAKNAVLKESEYLHGHNTDYIWDMKIRAQMLDLTMQFVISVCPEITRQSVMDLVTA